MSQPRWKLVAQLGDANPIEYGGYFVYIDETGVYPPQAELLEAITWPDGELKGRWDVYRFALEPCTFIDGILSDNPSHPEHEAWFADSLDGMASVFGIEHHSLVADFCSDDPIRRAHAWRTVGEYHGLVNLDEYPLTLNRSEVEKRYA